MPTKSLRMRVKKAKSRGTPPAIRDSDLGRVTGKSRHAAKKSRSVRARASVADRNVSRRAAPGEGIASRPQAEFPPAPPSPKRNRSRRRMAGTTLRAPKIGSDRPMRGIDVPF